MLGVAHASAEEAPAPEPSFTADVTPFLTRFCADCHSGPESEAGVDLASVETLEDAQRDPSRWKQVKGLIKLGAMPPSDHFDLPTVEERAKVVKAIEWTLERADCDAMDSPGWVTIRRLNALEYNNTIRDLLGVDFDPSEQVGFPTDDVGNGFDNQGDVLSLSPILLEKYLKAAELISRRVVSLDTDALRKQQISGRTLLVGESLGGEVTLAPGEYRFRASIKGRSRSGQEARVELTLDGKPLGEAAIEGDWRTIDFTREVAEDEGTFEGRLELRFVEVAKGPEDEGAGGNASQSKDRDGDRRRGDRPRRIEVAWLEVEGPAEGPAPMPTLHRRLVIATPKSDNEPDVREAAEKVFAAFLPRAYRRPATPNEVARIADIVVRGTQQGATYPEALRVGLQAALVSPHFLFRVEDRPDGSGNNPRKLTDHQLASRLSYFLWSSTPDSTLYDVASQGALHLPSRLRGEARRMLADPRCDALVESFFTQWLGLKNLVSVDRDRQHFPAWNGYLQAAMVRETQELCRAMIREDRSLVDLIDADYTFVNPRLAEHYGIEYQGRDPKELYHHVEGHPDDSRWGGRAGQYEHENDWVRVPAPPHRRGVLTHAAVLALTSNPIQTSPVKRGKWVLETLLGDPPPPAPPSVPSLEELDPEAHKLPLRDQLAIHRSNPSCASCHVRMDPIGLAMENYDAVGRWRDDFNGQPIDPAGELDGQPFAGPMELAELIRKQEKTVVRNAVERMLTYALGRGLRLEDQCYVDDIVRSAAKDNYRVSSVIAAIVVSEPFRMSGHALPKQKAPKAEEPRPVAASPVLNHLTPRAARLGLVASWAPTQPEPLAPSHP